LFQIWFLMVGVLDENKKNLEIEVFKK